MLKAGMQATTILQDRQLYLGPGYVTNPQATEPRSPHLVLQQVVPVVVVQSVEVVPVVDHDAVRALHAQGAGVGPGKRVGPDGLQFACGRKAEARNSHWQCHIQPAGMYISVCMYANRCSSEAMHMFCNFLL